MADATTQDMTQVWPALRRNAVALGRALPKAARGNEGAVHRARVATRRLREALPVTGEDESLARDLRRLTRALGPVREMDVCRALIRDLAAESTWPSRLVNRLDSACAEQRERALHRLESAVRRVDSERLMRAIVERAAEQDRPALARAISGALRSRVVKRADELSGAISDAGTVYAPEKLHVVRKAAKKLRYAVEMSPPSVRRTAAGLRRVQEELGTLHDLQMVQRRLQELATDGHDAWMLRVATALERQMEARCRELHGAIVQRVPALVRLLDRLRDAPARVRPRAARARSGGRILRFQRTA
jgi:CHAD domain-containing protein